MDSQFTRTAGPRAVRSYQNLHNRTALMGEPARTPSPNLSSGLSRSFSGQTSSSAPTSSSSFKVKMDDSELDQLEGQNDDQIGGLREKVAKLKNLTVRINDEITGSNKLIETMTDQFQNTGSILGSTMNKFQVMAAKEGGMTMCYMIVFIVFVIMLFYYFFFR